MKYKISDYCVEDTGGDYIIKEEYEQENEEMSQKKTSFKKSIKIYKDENNSNNNKRNWVFVITI